MQKKILFIIHSFSTGGGAEALLTRIVNGLDKNKYQISIIEIEHRDIKTEPTDSNITILPYIMRADDPDRNKKLYYVYHEPEKVFNEHIHEEYDLYIAFNYMKPTLLLPKGKRNIAWIHTDVYNLLDESKKENRMLQGEAFEKIQKIIAVSDNTAKSLAELFPENKDKIEIIYPFVETDKIKKLADEKCGDKLLHPNMLYSGRLEERKSPTRVVEVLQLVHQKNPNVHLYYMGADFGEMGKIEELIEKYRLHEYVHFLGYKQNPHPYIKQMDVMCFLSNREGFPICLLECAVLNKPFVATDVGGAETLTFDGKCGSVVETNEEAAQAVLKYIGEKNQNEGDYRRSIGRFSKDVILRQIERVIDEALSENEKEAGNY